MARAMAGLSRRESQGGRGMKAIWKFPIPVEDLAEVRIPLGGKILCVQAQHEIPCLWALVDPQEKPELRVFRTYGTGHKIIGDPGHYIGTYQLDGGRLVFHVFEV